MQGTSKGSTTSCSLRAHSSLSSAQTFLCHCLRSFCLQVKGNQPTCCTDSQVHCGVSFYFIKLCKLHLPGKKPPVVTARCHLGSVTADSQQTALSENQRLPHVRAKLTSVSLTFPTINTHRVLVSRIKIHKSKAESMK